MPHPGLELIQGVERIAGHRQRGAPGQAQAGIADRSEPERREPVRQAEAVMAVGAEPAALHLPAQPAREAIRGVLQVPLVELHRGIGARPRVGAAEVQAHAGIRVQAEVGHAKTPGGQVRARHEGGPLPDRTRTEEVAVRLADAGHGVAVRGLQPAAGRHHLAGRDAVLLEPAIVHPLHPGVEPEHVLLPRSRHRGGDQQDHAQADAGAHPDFPRRTSRVR